MRYLLLLLLLSSCFMHLPAGVSRHVRGNGYIGYVFNEHYDVRYNLSEDSATGRFTPTKEEIELVEKVLREKLPAIDYSKKPMVSKNLHKYIRQYFGFINAKGEKVIWVNSVWDKAGSHAKVAAELVDVSDGGSYYWNTFINLSDEKLLQFAINGVA
ncbi:hypothetical protein [Chitinophaga vietnamensis]|uniref:hypothetical protein n=1 Tax=Chitinophaga vietnamensis TaxID=2593957 RepID=UPI001178B9EC|nr:hypothetical protein [Chitinophaga vietnamensis]